MDPFSMVDEDNPFFQEFLDTQVNVPMGDDFPMVPDSPMKIQVPEEEESKPVEEESSEP
jgi:hypothetical protein